MSLQGLLSYIPLIFGWLALQKKNITTSKVGFPRSNGMEEDDLYNLIHDISTMIEYKIYIYIIFHIYIYTQYLNLSRGGNLCPCTAKKQTSGLKFDAFGGFGCTSIFIVNL